MKVDYSLYLCTDRNLLNGKNFEETIELAIKGGVSIVQLREKNCSSRKFLEIATSVKNITSKYKIPLIINDRIDIALAVDANGVHIGQDDLPCKTAREILGAEKIIGVSVSTVAEAIQAENDGANYLGVGAIFKTSTKTDAEIVSLDTLKKIRDSVKISVVAIGGINKDNLSQIKDFVDGVAVISAIISNENPEDAAKDLLKIFKKLRKNL